MELEVESLFVGVWLVLGFRFLFFFCSKEVGVRNLGVFFLGDGREGGIEDIGVFVFLMLCGGIKVVCVG